MNTYFETSDYDKFRFGKFNRSIDQANVEQKKRSIRLYGLLDPITVQKEGKSYVIYDGMHRFIACTELEVPLKCLLTSNETRETVIARNSAVKPWKNDDLVNGYANGGNENYKLINKFKTLYPDFRSESYSIILATNSDVVNTRGNLKNGTFLVTDFKASCEFADKLMLIKPYSKVYIKNRFINAIKQIIQTNPKFDWDWFIRNLSKPKFQYIFDGIDICGIFKDKIIEVYNDCARNVARIN
jgi:hypothetical protein